MNDPPNLFEDPEYQEAQGWPFTLQKQAKDGNVQAILFLANFEFANDNTPAALKYYRKAAREFNNLEATLIIIKIYEHGIGCDADLVKACQWMKKVLMTIESTPDQWKHPRIREGIIVNYGWYMLGEQTPPQEGKPQIQLPEKKRNVKDGLKWLERAVDMGDVDVASELANTYMSGDNPKIPVNYEKGMTLLEKAAELGHGKCAWELALAYRIGAVPVDGEKHKYWREKAIELGYDEATQDMQEKFATCLSKYQTATMIRKLEKDENIEFLLTTDESIKCSNPLCDATEKPGKGRFDVCVACRHVKYCSKACQRAHWKSGHKQDCPKLKEKKEHTKKQHIDILKTATKNRAVGDFSLS